MSGTTDACHNPYFNRWFSAIELSIIHEIAETGHNPYFNRWFSAMVAGVVKKLFLKKSQSLF